MLENWKTKWRESDKVTAKVIYDLAAGEVRVSLRCVAKPQQQSFDIKRDLATTLQEVDDLIREQTKKQIMLPSAHLAIL